MALKAMHNVVDHHKRIKFRIRAEFLLQCHIVDAEHIVASALSRSIPASCRHGSSLHLPGDESPKEGL